MIVTISDNLILVYAKSYLPEFLHDLAFRLVRLLIGLGILNVILLPSCA